MLVVARIVCGAATGGIYPVGMAIISDAVPLSERQVGIARWLAIVISGNLLGSAFAGGLADLFGWRAVFLGVGLCAVAALINARINLWHVPQAPPARLDLASIPSRYLAIFANPRAKFCFLARVPGGGGDLRAVLVRRPAAGGRRRAARLHRRVGDRRVLGGWHRLLRWR